MSVVQPTFNVSPGGPCVSVLSPLSEACFVGRRFDLCVVFRVMGTNAVICVPQRGEAGAETCFWNSINIVLQSTVQALQWIDVCVQQSFPPTICCDLEWGLTCSQLNSGSISNSANHWPHWCSKTGIQCTGIVKVLFILFVLYFYNPQWL